MTAIIFNAKYKPYLEHMFNGMELHNEEAINYMDKQFSKYIKSNPDFKYSQIKLNLNTCCISCTADSETIHEWQTAINHIYNK
jgi:hypothetical protein